MSTQNNPRQSLVHSDGGLFISPQGNGWHRPQAHYCFLLSSSNHLQIRLATRPAITETKNEIKSIWASLLSVTRLENSNVSIITHIDRKIKHKQNIRTIGQLRSLCGCFLLFISLSEDNRSRQRESNPPSQLGKLMYYRYTMSAKLCTFANGTIRIEKHPRILRG